ncbi:MAG: hypothetical protein U0805_08270 [Pirellulales bacterium]
MSSSADRGWRAQAGQLAEDVRHERVADPIIIMGVRGGKEAVTDSTFVPPTLWAV